METHHISPKHLTIAQVEEIITRGYKLTLSEESKHAIEECRRFLDTKTASQREPIYGVTTGFGSLCNININPDQLSQLQKNLVMSHACSIGEPLQPQVVKLMLLCKIQSLSYGKSGVQLQTVERLIHFFNNDILPVVCRQGSLGASGDLAPLANMSLPLLGMGSVHYKGKVVDAAEMLAAEGLEPIVLQSKEGLALLNGTQFMLAHGLWGVIQARRINRLADLVGALSLDAFNGRIEPFSPLIQQVRPHQGQIDTARAVSAYLQGSEIIAQPKPHVQDPYSFRCIPQVHGAVKDATEYVASVLETELNSVTDNPTVFPEADCVISAGNFHGEPIALPMDYLCFALAELADISERRTYKLVSGIRALPSFLVANPGLNSGFMIPQYAAASIVNRNKVLCWPASCDSITSSQGQEDHVSMGGNSATKLVEVADNTWRVLAIELLNGAQALEFRRPLKSSPIIEDLVARFRTHVPFVENDTVMYPLINNAEAFLKSCAENA